MASLDILNALGVGDRVVGTASTRLEYLQDYINDEIANLGTIKEAALEAIMACEPDVIFISGRLSSSYDALSEIAPVVFLATDTELGIVESVRRNAATIASMFGLEDQVDELMAGFDARIQALQAVSEGQTAIVGMCTSGSFNVPGNDGRCSIIGVEAGFENIGVDANIDTSTHGNEASFEFLVEKAPDYIFVMDRDAAIGTDSAQLAQDIMENELVMGTEAYKNGHLVYLAHPAVGTPPRAASARWISCCRIWRTICWDKPPFRELTVLPSNHSHLCDKSTSSKNRGVLTMEQEYRMPLIGDKAPSFEAVTTQDPVKFPEDYAGK